MPAPLVERKPVTDITKAFHYTDLQRKKPTRENDPYTYMHGWGNRHQSEVIPGTLPVAQNNPQEVRFGKNSMLQNLRYERGADCQKVSILRASHIVHSPLLEPTTTVSICTE